MLPAHLQGWKRGGLSGERQMRQVGGLAEVKASTMNGREVGAVAVAVSGIKTGVEWSGDISSGGFIVDLDGGSDCRVRGLGDITSTSSEVATARLDKSMQRPSKDVWRSGRWQQINARRHAQSRTIGDRHMSSRCLRPNSPCCPGQQALQVACSGHATRGAGPGEEELFVQPFLFALVSLSGNRVDSLVEENPMFGIYCCTS